MRAASFPGMAFAPPLAVIHLEGSRVVTEYMAESNLTYESKVVAFKVNSAWAFLAVLVFVLACVFPDLFTAFVYKVATFVHTYFISHWVR